MQQSQYVKLYLPNRGKADTWLVVLASSHIGNLSSTSSDAEVQVVMLMSLLMFCFEIWCGQDLRASFHLRTGLRILYDRVKLPGDTSSAEKKRLVEVKVNPQSDMDVLLQTVSCILGFGLTVTNFWAVRPTRHGLNDPVSRSLCTRRDLATP